MNGHSTNGNGHNTGYGNNNQIKKEQIAFDNGRSMNHNGSSMNANGHNTSYGNNNEIKKEQMPFDDSEPVRIGRSRDPRIPRLLRRKVYPPERYNGDCDNNNNNNNNNNDNDNDSSPEWELSSVKSESESDSPFIDNDKDTLRIAYDQGTILKSESYDEVDDASKKNLVQLAIRTLAKDAEVGEDDRLICRFCKHTLKTEATLKVHLARYHCQVMKPYPCDSCELSFAYLCLLTAHKRKHINVNQHIKMERDVINRKRQDCNTTRIYGCKRCHRKFANFTDMSNHSTNCN